MGDSGRVVSDAYIESGHVYVTGTGYPSIHIYVRSRGLANQIAQILGARVLPHGMTNDVAITSRKALPDAITILLQGAVRDDQRVQLQVLQEYALEDKREKREAIVERLRAICTK